MEGKYTIRIYNKNSIKRLKEIYGKCRSIFSSLNPFLVECVNRGMESISNDLFDDNKLLDLNTIYNQNNEILNALKTLNKEKIKSVQNAYSNSIINQKLLSCIYNIALGLSEEKPLNKANIDNGLYDHLPIRLSELLDKISN